MLDFPLLMLYMEEGKFQEVLSRLQDLIDHRPFNKLSEEDIQNVFNILNYIHFYSTSSDSSEHNKDFPVCYALIKAINYLLCRQEAAERIFKKDLISYRFIDYVLAPENQELHLLSNVIIQEWFCNYVKRQSSAFFQIIFSDISYIERIAQEMNLNYLCGQHGEHILTLAVHKLVDLELFEALIAHGADVNGYVEFPNFFNKLFRSRNIYLEDPLSVYSRYPTHEDAKIYIEHQEKYPLYEAIFQGQTAKAMCLIKSPNIQLDCVAFAQQFSNSIYTQIREPNLLMLAAYLGNMPVVQALLAKGMDIHALDNSGESVIFYALRARELDLLHYLLDSGASASIRNTANQTIFDLIELFDYREISDSFRISQRFSLMFCEAKFAFHQYISDHIDRLMHCFGEAMPKSDVLTNTEAKLGLMMFAGHKKPPIVFAGQADAAVLIMKQDNDLYQLRFISNSVRASFRILMLAHHMQALASLPAEIRGYIASYFSYTMIRDLFVTEYEMHACLPELESGSYQRGR